MKITKSGKMDNEAIGAISANSDNQSINQGCPSGFRRETVTGIDLGSPNGDGTVIAAALDESTPMAEDAWKQIVEELGKPRFVFERTFEGVRYTRRLK